jgi:hypothetical protein
LDPAGLINSIVSSAANIDKGRKFLATDNLEHAGRLFYEDGITTALDTFKNAQASADPLTMILVELSFLRQDFQFCDESDTITRSSLAQAIQSFEDSLRSLKIVENITLYRGAEATYPTSPKYRFHGFPRDAIHLACAAHRTRLQNSLRTPGINMIEKAVLTQRAANMPSIQAAYTEKQRNVFEKNRYENNASN